MTDSYHSEMIPITILTGFLGAGKTTLLKKILNEPHGSRIAVIENEYGESNIDSELLRTDEKKQIIELANGCICCTIHEDLVNALLKLEKKRESGEVSFERIMIETTGLADPGPICQTFFMDDEISNKYRLDAIITIVDAKHGMETLDTEENAQSQVGFADRILVSKSDLIHQKTYQALYSRLTKINPRAPIIPISFGNIELQSILDINGFNLDAILDINPKFLEEKPINDQLSHTRNGVHAIHNYDEIGTFLFQSNKPFNSDLLNEFIERIIQIYGPRLLRYKGILYISGMDYRMLFQGVRTIIGAEPGEVWLPSEKPTTRIVFIGRNLPNDVFLKGLENCVE